MATPMKLALVLLTLGLVAALLLPSDPYVDHDHEGRFP